MTGALTDRTTILTTSPSYLVSWNDIMSEEYKTRLLKACKDIVGPAPGSPFNCLWLGNGSCLSSSDLRIIADEIDRIDEEEEMNKLNEREGLNNGDD